ncbi:hypothetical protein APHAL10511_006059 [Amanita phalloides]|nr:hypothetical protein APHAL10511_006059 [Amanita phalloides]
MPTAELKLTKKQKKALAFRSRTKRSNQTNGNVPEPQAQSPAASALENESDSGEERGAQEMGRMDAQIAADSESDVAGEARMDRKVESSLQQATKKKRKRETLDDDGSSGQEGQKKMRKEGTSAADISHSKKERFILFVGNLKYTTTVEAIRQHFSSCDPPPDVRLLTPKSAAGKRSTKSKGCAFVEFTSRKGLQQALKLHQSKLDGRMINVELTAGGGGKGEARLKKLQGRNKTLHSQRQKTKQGTSDTTDSNQPQRYSATSGVGQVPKQKRTWSVDNAVDKNNKSKRRRPMRNMATGVNSIPVG